MRSIVYLVVIATLSMLICADLPAVLAAEDQAASLPLQQSVLKAADGMVAKVDTQPTQVLIEAAIVQVGPDKDPKAAAGSSIFERAMKANHAGKNGVSPNADDSSAAHVEGDKPVNASGGCGDDAKALQFGWIDGSTNDFIHSLEHYGEVKVLGCPRLLVLNKQRADICFGGRESGQSTGQNQGDSSPTANSSGIETNLRLRPFVSSDDTIRLEAHLELSMEHKNPNGITDNTTAQITTNILMLEGGTVVIGGLSDVEIAAGTEKSPTATSTTKKELLLILTPRIWRPTSLSNANVIHPGDLTFKAQPIFNP